MSNPVIYGLHHITLCASGAQEDVDFITQVLGLRLIKQTVLFDGRYAHYHLYYGNANAEVGSVLTTFPYRRIPGRPGSGQISATSYAVSKGTLPFWKDHLNRHKIEHSGIQERFGQQFIRFTHPSGLLLEVIEDANDTRAGWATDQIDSQVAARGFHGPVLSVREVEEEERFFIEALGFRKTGVDGPYHRFEIGSGGAGKRSWACSNRSLCPKRIVRPEHRRRRAWFRRRSRRPPRLVEPRRRDVPMRRSSAATSRSSDGAWCVRKLRTFPLVVSLSPLVVSLSNHEADRSSF